MRATTRPSRWPSAHPTATPTSSCCANIGAIVAKPLPGTRISSIIATVRKTAIGSFRPDSTSSVASTRSFSRSPPPPSSANTAAASVDPTIAPSSSPYRQSSPSSATAIAPTADAVMRTPRVASVSAGPATIRSVPNRVRSPPSSRMTASARLPISAAVATGMSTTGAPGSSVATSPTARKTSSDGTPRRVDAADSATAANSSKEATSSA